MLNFFSANLRLLPRLFSRLILIIGIGLLAILSYLLLYFLENNLSTQDYGEFAAFWSIVMGLIMGFTFPLETFGLSLNNMNLTKKEILQKELSAIKTVVSFLLIVVIVPSPIYIPKLFRGNWLYLLALVLITISFAIIYANRAKFLNEKKFSFYATFMVLEGILRIGLCVLAAYLFGTTGVNAALAVSLAALVAAAISSKITRVDYSKIFSSKFKYANSIMKIVFGNLLIILALNIGPFIIHAYDPTGNLSGPELNALTISRIPVFLGPVIQSLLIPKFQLIHNSKRILNKVFVFKSLAVASFISLLWVFFFGNFGQSVTNLFFGVNSTSTMTNFYLLGLLTGLYLLLITLQAYFVAINLSSIFAKALALGAISSVIVIFLPVEIVLKAEILSCLAIGVPLIYLLSKLKKIDLDKVLIK